MSTGSLAGMRLLHQLKQHLGERLSIWPFDDIADGKTDLVLVEIFPSLYFYRLGMAPAKKAAADPAFLNRALAAYDSEGVKPSFTQWEMTQMRLMRSFLRLPCAISALHLDLLYQPIAWQ